MEGPFQLNEFATLAPEDLHFLRIFVRSEGRIKDMETALGLSYPTIRNRLTTLKTKLQGATGETETPEPDAAPEVQIKRILAQLQGGEIPFEKAMERIREVRASTKSP